MRTFLLSFVLTSLVLASCSSEDATTGNLSEYCSYGNFVAGECSF